MTYEPIYSGTLEEIERDAPAARVWMIERCREAASGLEDHLRVEIETMLQEVSTDNLPGAFSQGRDASTQRLYYHSWVIGSCGSDMPITFHRFTISPDGTVDMDRLTTCLQGYADRMVTERARQGVMAMNSHLLDQQGDEWRYIDGVKVELSTTSVGNCTVIYKSGNVLIGPTVIRIAKVAAFVDAMRVDVETINEAIREM